jgi:hypothetical protein
VNTKPKTDHLTPWQPGTPSPNPGGRPRKFITSFKRDGLRQSQVNDIILVMLAMNESELTAIVDNGNATIIELTIARALLNGAKKGSLYAMESLLNRSVGMPKIQQEVNIEQRNVIVSLNLS